MKYAVYWGICSAAIFQRFAQILFRNDRPVYVPRRGRCGSPLGGRWIFALGIEVMTGMVRRASSRDVHGKALGSFDELREETATVHHAANCSFVGRNLTPQPMRECCCPAGVRHVPKSPNHPKPKNKQFCIDEALCGLFPCSEIYNLLKQVLVVC